MSPKFLEPWPLRILSATLRELPTTGQIRAKIVLETLIRKDYIFCHDGKIFGPNTSLAPTIPDEWQKIIPYLFQVWDAFEKIQADLQADMDHPDYSLTLEEVRKELYRGIGI